MNPQRPAAVEVASEGTCTTAVRGWTGEFFQTREVVAGDYRLWHPDGSYYGRLIPDAAHTQDLASGTVFGPTGLYLADVTRGRLRVEPLRRRARAVAEGYPAEAFDPPGNLGSVERRWPRRG
jgi:hypothetical protein